MRGRVIALASIVCLSALTVLPAAGQDLQPSTDPQTGQNLEMAEGNLLRADKNVEMAEDLEVMGAILRATLTQVYAPPGTQPGVGSFDVFHYNEDPRSAGTYRSRGPGRGSARYDPNAMVADDAYGEYYDPVGAAYGALTGEITPGPPKAFAIKRPEGVYLENYGVVYQITLDAPAPEEQQPKDAAKNGDEHPRAARAWEIATRSLRGQPPSQPPRAADEVNPLPTKDDLVGKLLDVLAENAGNLRHLKSQDRLTVGITFPRSEAPTTLAGKSDRNVAISPLVTDIAHPRSWVGTVGQEWRKTHGDLAAGRGSHEVSGDLHMRQKNYQQAIEAYRKALSLLPDSPSLRIKSAQVYLRLGDLQNAQKLIEEARKLAPLLANRHSKPAATQLRKIPLPARLTVSVTKSRLDEVAAGKMKPEELKGHATIDYFNPPATRPGLGAPKPRPSSTYQEPMGFDSDPSEYGGSTPPTNNPGARY